MESYRVKHPKLNSSDSRRLVKILTKDGKKGEGIVSVVKDGEEIWKFSPGRVDRDSGNLKIRHYDYYTCEELVNYEHE